MAGKNWGVCPPSLTNNIVSTKLKLGFALVENELVFNGGCKLCTLKER